LAALSIIVLIVACANVTNLLLVNNVRLRRELAIRASLGAGPARVAGQLLAQTVVLTALGGVAGLVLWFTLSPMLHAAFLPTVGFTTSDLLPRVLAFAGVAVVVTSLAAGFVPALQTRRLTDIGSLRAGARGSTTGSSRLRHTLVAIQAALSVVLLVGAGLFVVSLLRAREFDMGFSAEGVAEVELEFRTGVGRARRIEVFGETLNRIRSIPGVRSAATYAGSRPLEFGMGYSLHIPGRDSVPTMPGGWPSWLQGSADFLDVYGFRIVRGRATDPTDVQPGAEPVMLVSRLTAQTLWPDGDVLNKCALVVDTDDRGPNGEVSPCRRIVGVFENVVARQLGEPPAFAFFIPVDMNTWHPWGLSLRAERLDARMLEQIRTEIQAVSTDIYFVDAAPVSQRVEKVLKQWTLGARLFTAFGLLGLVMACIGLYSILAFDVAERKRELGIRSALGAESTRLVNAVLRNSMVYVLGGLLAGTAFALLAGRLLEDLLFQTTAADPRVYGAVIGALLLSGLAAGTLPSLRAAAADPMEAIRTD
jgi:predicted permease